MHLPTRRRLSASCLPICLLVLAWCGAAAAEDSRERNSRLAGDIIAQWERSLPAEGFQPLPDPEERERRAAWLEYRHAERQRVFRAARFTMGRFRIRPDDRRIPVLAEISRIAASFSETGTTVGGAIITHPLYWRPTGYPGISRSSSSAPARLISTSLMHFTAYDGVSIVQGQFPGLFGRQREVRRSDGAVIDEFTTWNGRLIGSMPPEELRRWQEDSGGPEAGDDAEDALIRQHSRIMFVPDARDALLVGPAVLPSNAAWSAMAEPLSFMGHPLASVREIDHSPVGQMIRALRRQESAPTTTELIYSLGRAVVGYRVTHGDDFLILTEVCCDAEGRPLSFCSVGVTEAGAEASSRVLRWTARRDANGRMVDLLDWDSTSNVVSPTLRARLGPLADLLPEPSDDPEESLLVFRYDEINNLAPASTITDPLVEVARALGLRLAVVEADEGGETIAFGPGSVVTGPAENDPSFPARWDEAARALLDGLPPAPVGREQFLPYEEIIAERTERRVLPAPLATIEVPRSR
jgi:hypothetical protein